MSSPTEQSIGGLRRLLTAPALWVFVVAMVAAGCVGRLVPATWTVEKVLLDVQRDGETPDSFYYISRGEAVTLGATVPFEDALLHPERIEEYNAQGRAPGTLEEFAIAEGLAGDAGEVPRVFHLVAKRHWRYWSMLPALAAVLLCWLTREPLTSLFGGILVGAMLLGQYNITESVLVKNLATVNAAGVLLLYLWLLGGLMGIWSRTGAAQAFADLMTRKVVRGPRSAKLVAWGLGIVFFQGGTVSTVLVGTTVKPLADKERISHEELAYIVDSTASPIASQLAFNAWPGYIQAFIFVAGVSWLATEEARITFFFKSVPFCFYAIFAIMFTFLLSIEKSPFLGRKLKAAIQRARSTGELDAPDAEPLSARELQMSNVPAGYRPHVVDFFAPLVILLAIAIGTFIFQGSPQVRWAFGMAVVCAMVLALARGMSLKHVMEGFGNGLKGVVLGSVILLLAMIIGNISKEAGGGIYLVELLGESLPYWLLPVLLQILTIVIAFSTGTSWGTYAVAFPLAMPLSWAIANAQNLEHPQFFMTICFAAVMDGSVFGDQCSPISDTTVLSAMCTGCDLMDHVKTQLPQASIAALLAGICWTTLTVLFA